MLGLSANTKKTYWAAGLRPTTLRFHGSAKGETESLSDVESVVQEEPVHHGGQLPKGQPAITEPAELSRQASPDSGLAEPEKRHSRHGDSVELTKKPAKEVIPVEKKARRQAHSRAADSSDEEEPVPVEHPPADQYAAYYADRKRQQHLEWGRKYETPARALDWVDNHLKTMSRQATGMVGGLRGVVTHTANQAVAQSRKAAAGVLKRAAQALESGLESPPPEKQHARSTVDEDFTESPLGD